MVFNQIIILIREQKKNFTFLDIGSHVGYYSVLCKEFAKDSIVHAFEPNPDNFLVLNKNADMYKNFNTHNSAIFN